MDRHTVDQIESALRRLNVPITVIDKDAAGGDKSLSALAFSGQDVLSVGGAFYRPVAQGQLLLACASEVPGAKNMLRLAGALVDSMGCGAKNAGGSMDVYRRTLLGELSGCMLESLSHDHQIPTELNRCVMVFHVMQTKNDRAYQLLADITPLEDRDVLVDMDTHTAALIKDLSDDETMDDLLQYGQALQETLMSETARQMTVGIGRACHTIDELWESYSEAKRAIEVGRVFQPEESIFAYSRLIMERLLLELPTEVASAYHDMLFNRGNARLFNDEMLYTIDMFLKKDLNLSDTARQLYIHRNTLVYRLDKVQRQTGLDLRSFDDAVTFKILMELEKCGNPAVKNK